MLYAKDVAVQCITNKGMSISKQNKTSLCFSAPEKGVKHSVIDAMSLNALKQSTLS